MEEKEFKERLKEQANKINIELNKEQLDLFFKYKTLILEWNEKINLTAIKNDEEFINKHFIDSLMIAKYINTNKSTLLDIGTGAGFPGIPIKIVKDNNITLLDSLNKRLKVLENVIQRLELSHIETLHGRAEEVFKNKKYREKYDVATSRAVANLNTLVECGYIEKLEPTNRKSTYKLNSEILYK